MSLSPRLDLMYLPFKPNERGKEGALWLARRPKAPLELSGAFVALGIIFSNADSGICFIASCADMLL
jgi:hypothetical protein